MNSAIAYTRATPDRFVYQNKDIVIILLKHSGDVCDK